MRRMQVSGGECGLPLARRRFDGGAAVTRVTDRAAPAGPAGAVTSTPVEPARTWERESTVRRGTRRAPRAIRVTAGVGRVTVAGRSASFDSPAQSSDRMQEWIRAGEHDAVAARTFAGFARPADAPLPAA